MTLSFSRVVVRVGPTWSTVCGCYDGGYRCQDQGMQDALATEEGLFYSIGLNFYNVLYMCPDANMWVIGHSLGGGLLSALIGVAFLPVVAVEGPAEKMAA